MILSVQEMNHFNNQEVGYLGLEMDSSNKELKVNNDMLGTIKCNNAIMRISV